MPSATSPRWVSRTPEDVAAWERSQASHQAAERFSRSGMAQAFRGADVSTCHPTAQDFASMLAETFTGSRPQGGGLLLVGRTGRGKTYTACAVANSCLSRHGALFIESQDLDAVGFDAELLSRAKGAPLLILDDVGNEHTKGHKHAVMFEVIKARCDNLRPTVITSQYTPQGLYQRLDGEASELKEAFLSRLSRCFETVVLDGGDRR